MKDFIYRIWSRFLTQFGKIKIMTFSFIPILAYESKPYVVNGYDMDRITKIVEPGDILLRGYDCYLDGKFIPDRLGYSHAGVYAGNNEVIHAAAPCIQTIHILDFCQSDRIMILRNREHAKKSVEIVKSKIGIPYDFNYEDDVDKMYCFELAAKSYPDIEIEEFEVKKFFGLVKRRCYLAKSLYENGSFEKIFERNLLNEG